MELEHKLTKIEPHYDFTKVGGGHFKLQFGQQDGQMFYTLGFVEFLEERLQHDTQLFDYIEAHHKQNTVSDAIKDLYELGAPIDQWVTDYIETARQDVNPTLFNALIDFYNQLIRVESSGSGSKS